MLKFPNIRLIQKAKQDSGFLKDRASRRMTIVHFEGFFTKKLGFFAFAFLFLFSAPHTVNAGFFSFMEGLLKPSDVVEIPIDKNSQTAIVLESVLTADLTGVHAESGTLSVVGGSAILPDTGPAGTVSEAEKGEKKKHGQISVYVVRKGDSLSEIARMFDVSPSTIIWANDIGAGGTVREGQTLVILPVSGIEYTVQKGDTLESIARKYKADPDEIREWNDISGALAAGDTIVIPGGLKEAPRVQTPGSTPGPIRGADAPYYAGYYIRPLEGGRKSQGLHGYNGVDLAAPQGTPLMASADGVVIISRETGWNGGYGKYIVIRHPNGTQTVYAHNFRNFVETGQIVIQGQVIGEVGSTGRSTGNHVHFEIRGARNPF